MPDNNSIDVDSSEAGFRLDVWLRDQLGVSRSRVGRLLDQGGVRVNGRVVKRSDKGRLLAAGDRVAIDQAAREDEQPAADGGKQLALLHEGDGWLAVDKPAGMPVRPRTVVEKGTVLNAVTAICPSVVGVGEGGLRSGIVHRLDNDTSGVLVVATQQGAWSMWREAFADHRTVKHYLAIVAGEVAIYEHRRIENDLTITSHRPSRVRVDPPGGGGEASRRCAIGIKSVERLLGATLLEVELETGFLHQIRAMLAHLGHPVLGDPVYGDRHTASAAPRQMLHAHSLVLDQICCQSPIPQDMQQVMDRLRVDAG